MSQYVDPEDPTVYKEVVEVKTPLGEWLTLSERCMVCGVSPNGDLPCSLHEMAYDLLYENEARRRRKNLLQGMGRGRGPLER